MRARTVLAGLTLTLLATGCAPWHDDDGPEHGRDGLGQTHLVSAARGDRDAASLTVVSGATTLAVRAADLGDDLYRISTPDNSGIAPDVVESGGRFQLHLRSTGDNGPAAVEILLDRRVRWDLRFSGGANETLVDLGGGRVAGLDFTAGSSRIETILPKPEGPVTVRMAGGASELLVRAPEGIPVRVTAGGGAANVTVDGNRRSGIAGGTVFAPPGWDSAADRYDVDAVAGVSTLTVTRP
ncbi:hypothetical protein Cme02nite_00030 [Catellatospora methionotrophica]|uniref:Lipoprotein n=1 Tax=Catellatospora methionotrophica TaxID=121620 RepID=A0A8J3PBS1_9ACTN|nr:hypothetical protein [Catellatospora methionotrophica]GIG11671.1 hypothetical protein Cme02nite_00030 [Catellatospora methionotrophica]